MNKVMTSTAALLLATTAACGGPDTAQQQAQDESPAPQASAADTANPYSDGEMSMGQKMMAAVGTDAGDNWVRKMIEHHRGAVEMSRIVLQNNPTPDVAKMAQDTIDKQTKEIGDLEKMVKDGKPDQRSAALYEPPMRAMQQAMMAAKGADASETWMKKMVEHHRGAIAMSDVLLKQGKASADVMREAQKTKSDQQKEMDMMQGMMRGEPMKAGSHASMSTAAGSASSSSSAPAASTPKPGSSPSARANDAMAGHDMSNMSNMSGNKR